MTAFNSLKALNLIYLHGVLGSQGYYGFVVMAALSKSVLNITTDFDVLDVLDFSVLVFNSKILDLILIV